MRATYDPEADAVYIYLVKDMGVGRIEKMVPVDPAEIEGGMIHLHFDGDHKLVGIEILGARELLFQEFLDSAKQLGSRG